MPRRAELPNLTPARVDITHYRGDTITVRLRLRNRGEPVDVNGWAMESHIRATSDGPEIARFRVVEDSAMLDDNDDPVLDPVTGDFVSYWSQGIVRLYLSEESAQLLPSTALWDLQVTRSVEHAGFRYDNVRTLVRGYIYSPADVTHPNIVSGLAARRR